MDPHLYENDSNLRPTAEELTRILDDVQDELEEDNGYHTPKNLFNSEITNLRKSMCHLNQRIDSRLEIYSDNEEDQMNRESSYSTIRKLPDEPSRISDLMVQSVCIPIQPPTLPPRKTFPVHSEGYLDTLLDDLQLPARSGRKLKDRLLQLNVRELCVHYNIERIDVALCISFIALVLTGLLGLYFFFFDW